MFSASLRNLLNKSHTGAKPLCGRGCAKGDEGNATAKGGAVSSEGRCDPVAGCTAQSSISAVVASPTRVDPASRVPRPALRVATAEGGAVSSEGRCDPVAGCTAQSSISAVVASPTRVDPASRVPRPALRVATAKGGAVPSEKRWDPVAGCGRLRTYNNRGLGTPAARSPLRRAPRATLWAPQRYTPWHRRPSYDLRREPCDHPDFTSNALRGGFVQRLPRVKLRKSLLTGLLFHLNTIIS